MRALVVLAVIAFAGCSSPAPELVDEARFVPPAWPGIELTGEVTEGFRMQATATNHGPHTYQVSAVCAPVWSDIMRKAGNQVDHKEPVSYCQQFEVKDFKAGQSIDFSTSWDGRLYNDGSFSDAPEGTYTWVAQFDVYNGETWAVLPLEFTIQV